MKAVLARFLKDNSGSSDVMGQAILVTGSSMVVIPMTDEIAAKLIVIFEKISKALH